MIYIFPFCSIRFSTSWRMIFFWKLTCSFCVWKDYAPLKENWVIRCQNPAGCTWLGTDLHFCFSANRVRKQLLHFAKQRVRRRNAPLDGATPCSWNDGGNDPFVPSFGPMLKFIYSEKATKFCEIFPLLLTVWAFSEYMNFNKIYSFQFLAHFWTDSESPEIKFLNLVLNIHICLYRNYKILFLLEKK